MNPIFKYKYSTKDMKGEYAGNTLVQDVHLNEKGPSVKILLLNVFKDRHVVTKSGPIVVSYDE